jgi:hypothetical protein
MYLRFEFNTQNMSLVVQTEHYFNDERLEFMLHKQEP